MKTFTKTTVINSDNFTAEFDSAYADEGFCITLRKYSGRTLERFVRELQQTPAYARFTANYGEFQVFSELEAMSLMNRLEHEIDMFERERNEHEQFPTEQMQLNSWINGYR